MKQRIWQGALFITVAMLLVSLIVASTALAVSQTWYLTDTASGSNYVMQKGSTGGGSTDVTLPADTTVIWEADEAAQANVGFTAGNWIGQLERSGSTAAATINVYIGIWDGASGSLTGSGTASFGAGSSIAAFSISADAFDVPQGQWLAFAVGNPYGVAGYLTTTGNSYVVSPSSDPGYPLPDVGAILMFAAGLVVVGWIVRKLRSQKGQETVAAV